MIPVLSAKIVNTTKKNALICFRTTPNHEEKKQPTRSDGESFFLGAKYTTRTSFLTEVSSSQFELATAT